MLTQVLVLTALMNVPSVIESAPGGCQSLMLVRTSAEEMFGLDGLYVGTMRSISLDPNVFNAKVPLTSIWNLHESVV